MAIGSFSAGLAKLRDAAERLTLQWEQAGLSWDDDVRRSIGEKQIEPLRQQLREAAEATARLRDVIMLAERDCGNPDRCE